MGVGVQSSLFRAKVLGVWVFRLRILGSARDKNDKELDLGFRGRRCLGVGLKLSTMPWVWASRVLGFKVLGSRFRGLNPKL